MLIHSLACAPVFSCGFNVYCTLCSVWAWLMYCGTGGLQSRHLSRPSYLFSPGLNLQSSVITSSYSLLIYLFLPFPQTSQGTLCSGSWEEREGIREHGWVAPGWGGEASGNRLWIQEKKVSFRMEEDRRQHLRSAKGWLVDKVVQNVPWSCRLSETVQMTSVAN